MLLCQGTFENFVTHRAVARFIFSVFNFGDGDERESLNGVEALLDGIVVCVFVGWIFIQPERLQVVCVASAAGRGEFNDTQFTQIVGDSLRRDDDFEQFLEGRFEVRFIMDEQRVLREKACVERTRSKAARVATEQ